MSHRAPYAIQSDGVRNLIGRRTQSNRTANAIRSDTVRRTMTHAISASPFFCAFIRVCLIFFVPFYLLQTAIFAIFATVSLILLH